MTIYAVRPPRGQVIHLHDPEYNLSESRPRVAGGAGSALCNAGLWSTHYPVEKIKDRLASISDALEWQPAEFDPRPWWKWCRPCLGHAVVIHGLERDVLTRVAERAS